MTITSTRSTELTGEPNDAAMTLRQRLQAKTATIAVVGLGYVGLPLVGALHEAGYGVLGYDIDKKKIEQLKRENGDLKEIVADLVIETHRLKKTAGPPLNHGSAGRT